MDSKQLAGHSSHVGEVHFWHGIHFFRVLYRVLLLSANSLRPSLSLFEMFGPSIKASTHALAIIWGWPNHSSSNHIAFLTPPGVPSDPASAFLALPWETEPNETSFVRQTDSETPPSDGNVFWIWRTHMDLWRTFSPPGGGKLAPVAIRFMLATTLLRTLVLSVLITLDVATHSLLGWGKGGALGFNVDFGTSSRILGFGMMVRGWVCFGQDSGINDSSFSFNHGSGYWTTFSKATGCLNPNVHKIVFVFKLNQPRLQCQLFHFLTITAAVSTFSL